MLGVAVTTSTSLVTAVDKCSEDMRMNMHGILQDQKDPDRHAVEDRVQEALKRRDRIAIPGTHFISIHHVDARDLLRPSMETVQALRSPAQDEAAQVTGIDLPILDQWEKGAVDEVFHQQHNFLSVPPNSKGEFPQVVYDVLKGGQLGMKILTLQTTDEKRIYPSHLKAFFEAVGSSVEGVNITYKDLTPEEAKIIAASSLQYLHLDGENLTLEVLQILLSGKPQICLKVQSFLKLLKQYPELIADTSKNKNIGYYDWRFANFNERITVAIAHRIYNSSATRYKEYSSDFPGVYSYYNDPQKYEADLHNAVLQALNFLGQATDADTVRSFEGNFMPAKEN